MSAVLTFPTPARHVAPPTPSDAHRALMLELVQALEQGQPQRLCLTPGFKPAQMTAAEIVNDDFAAAGDTSLDDLLRLLSRCCKSTDPEIRLGAQAWIAAAAKRHADFHFADAASGDGDAA
jgi:hypothetical protein